MQGSLQSIESKLRNGDDTGDQFMLQLKMAKLVMMLLNKVVGESVSSKPAADVMNNGQIPWLSLCGEIQMEII